MRKFQEDLRSGFSPSLPPSLTLAAVLVDFLNKLLITFRHFDVEMTLRNNKRIINIPCEPPKHMSSQNIFNATNLVRFLTKITVKCNIKFASDFLR